MGLLNLTHQEKGGMLNKRLVIILILSLIAFFSALAFADCYIVIQSDVANIRKWPDIKSEIVGKAPYKDVLWIERIEADWLYSPIKEGWIHKSACKIFKTAKEADDFAKHYWLEKSIETLRNEPGIRQEYIPFIWAKMIMIGMNKKEVLFSLDKPNKKIITVYPLSTHETWIYRLPDFKANYLFFENGILKSYQLER